MDREIARERADECRRIAREVASTPTAKLNWARLAKQWEAEAERIDEQGQSASIREESVGHEYDGRSQEF